MYFRSEATEEKRSFYEACPLQKKIRNINQKPTIILGRIADIMIEALNGEAEGKKGVYGKRVCPKETGEKQKEKKETRTTGAGFLVFVFSFSIFFGGTLFLCKVRKNHYVLLQ